MVQHDLTRFPPADDTTSTTVQLIVFLFFALLPGTATLAALSSRRRLQSEAPWLAGGGSDSPTTLSGFWDPCGQPDRRWIVSHFAVCGFCLSRLLLVGLGTAERAGHGIDWMRTRDGWNETWDWGIKGTAAGSGRWRIRNLYTLAESLFLHVCL